MPNILIRDLSQAAIDRIDDAAADLGLSRNEYLRRKFEQTTSEPGNRTVTAEDWKRSAETFALGYSARTGELGRREFASPLLALMPLEYPTPGIEDRAIEVQMLLADHGQHRAPSIPDLLVAATAEKAGLTVLAVDKDFNLIAQITGQPVEELAQ